MVIRGVGLLCQLQDLGSSDDRCIPWTGMIPQLKDWSVSRKQFTKSRFFPLEEIPCFQERSLTTNLNAANNYKAVAAFLVWNWEINPQCMAIFSWGKIIIWLIMYRSKAVQPFALGTRFSPSTPFFGPRRRGNFPSVSMAKFSFCQADHLRANMATLSAAKIVYSAGFFITVSPESMETLCSGQGWW